MGGVKRTFVHNRDQGPISWSYLSPVRTGLKMGKLTGQMGSLPILSPVRTAQEVFLPGNLPDSNG